jgi:hypothetical protein
MKQSRILKAPKEYLSPCAFPTVLMNVQHIAVCLSAAKRLRSPAAAAGETLNFKKHLAAAVR